MKKIETPIEGLFIIELDVFRDERGRFYETYKEQSFRELGLPTNFVQDNFSTSKKDVLRGLHYQNPTPQGKLVRVSHGKVWDVAVDIRPGSKTFGKHFGLELNEYTPQMFYIPEGFAHGFCVLSEEAHFQYKCTAPYSPRDEKGLLWNDSDLAITWPVKHPIVSEKDQKLGRLCELR